MATPANDVRLATPMDTDQLHAATQQLMKAASLLLDCAGCDQAAAQRELENVLTEAAEALRDVIDWIPRPDVETLELRAGLEHFLS